MVECAFVVIWSAETGANLNELLADIFAGMSRKALEFQRERVSKQMTIPSAT